MSARMNNTSKVKYDEGRLMQVLVAPIVSEKATMVAEKSDAEESYNRIDLPVITRFALYIAQEKK